MTPLRAEAAAAAPVCRLRLSAPIDCTLRVLGYSSLRTLAGPRQNSLRGQRHRHVHHSEGFFGGHSLREGRTLCMARTPPVAVLARVTSYKLQPAMTPAD